MKILRNEKGFTVLELLVVSGISLVIASAIFMAMRLGSEQLEGADLKMTIQDSAREGLYKMLQEIRESAPSRISFGNGGTGIQFTAPDPNNPATAPNYSVNWAAAHTVQYSLAGSQIRRSNLTTNQNSIIANDVTGITFAGNAPQPTVVTVTMNVQRTLKNSRVVPSVPLQITGQAKIRNP